jgi:hypothetical protein
VAAIAAGRFHSLALKSGGVLAWGCVGNDFGQCTVPAAATSGVTAIAAGRFHSLALKSGGVIAWGCGGTGNFGQCTVPAGAASGVIAIAAGAWHSLALKSDGSVLAWGCGSPNDYGQCSVPAAALNGVSAIAAGPYHSLAVDTAGPTAVTLRAFSASRTRSGTRLHWRTASEARTLGFNLYRDRNGKVVKLNRTLVPSVFGGTTSGHAYSFLDRTARRGATHTYRLQSVSLGGTRTWIGSAVARR